MFYRTAVIRNPLRVVQSAIRNRRRKDEQKAWAEGYRGDAWREGRVGGPAELEENLSGLRKVRGRFFVGRGLGATRPGSQDQKPVHDLGAGRPGASASARAQ